MAYILGLLASDGTIRKNINEIKLTLNEDDSEILERIKKELSFEGNVRHYEDSKGFKNATIAFTSAEIKKDLAKYNIIPQKLLLLLFQPILIKNIGLILFVVILMVMVVLELQDKDCVGRYVLLLAIHCKLL